VILRPSAKRDSTIFGVLEKGYSRDARADYDKQEAQLSPKDRAMRRVNWNFAYCHATVQKLLIRQVLTELMV